jgi:hypothetical protein
LQGQPVTALAGAPFSGVVATLTGPTSVTKLSSVINWGDGHASAGTILPDGSATFEISGGNTYGRSGSYSLFITVASTDGQTQIVATTATVLGQFRDSSLDLSAADGLGASQRNAFSGPSILLSGGADFAVQISQPPPTGRQQPPGVPQPPGPRPAAAQPPSLMRSPGMLGGLPPTVSPTEQVAWVNLSEQETAPAPQSSPAPVVARLVTPPPESRGLPAVVALPVPQDPRSLLALALGATSVPEDRVWLDPSPDYGAGSGPAEPLLNDTRTSVASQSEAAKDPASDVYHRPLHQVADLRELRGSPAGPPYLLSQEDLVAWNLAAPLLPPGLGRGRRAVDGTSDDAAAGGTLAAPRQATLQSAREAPQSRSKRVWFIAASACVLQTLYATLFRPARTLPVQPRPTEAR